LPYPTSPLPAYTTVPSEAARTESPRLPAMSSPLPASPAAPKRDNNTPLIGQFHANEALADDCVVTTGDIAPTSGAFFCDSRHSFGVRRRKSRRGCRPWRRSYHRLGDRRSNSYRGHRLPHQAQALPGVDQEVLIQPIDTRQITVIFVVANRNGVQGVACCHSMCAGADAPVNERSTTTGGLPAQAPSTSTKPTTHHHFTLTHPR
jgi:hypothetical protein